MPHIAQYWSDVLSRKPVHTADQHKVRLLPPPAPMKEEALVIDQRQRTLW
jgi:hypothetical protein